MTAVARALIRGCPMMLGDLLLSGPKEKPHIPELPTVKDYRDLFPAGDRMLPNSLGQKLVLVSERLLVGWSGDREVAKRAIESMREREQENRFTRDTLEQLIADLDASVFPSELQLAGFFRESPEELWHFDLNAPVNFSSPVLGDVALLGSGAKALEVELLNFPDVSHARERDLKPVEQAVTLALGLAGLLTSAEIAWGATLLERYGGGYEIAIDVGGRFAKLDSITYAFWEARLEHDHVRIAERPAVTCRYSYVGDWLAIRAARFKDAGPERVAIEDRMFPIAPVYSCTRPHELDSLVPPSLNAKYLCIFFVVQMPESSPQFLLRFCAKVNADDRRWLHFNEGGTDASIEVEKDFVLEVADAIIKRKENS